MSLMLYLHIPFCVRKCAYCDFVSYAGCEAAMPRYVDALIAEMDRRPSRERVSSVFFGGGTPSLLSAGELSRLLRAIRERYDLMEHCEISSEANPGTVTPQWLDAAAEGGVNRLSVGVQTVQPELLKKIGRIHDFAQAEQTFEMARAAGIRNLSADLMYALPGQTVAVTFAVCANRTERRFLWHMTRKRRSGPRRMHWRFVPLFRLAAICWRRVRIVL